MEKKYALKPEVAAKYEVVGDQLHAYFPGFGEVDLTELNLEAAESFVARGFPYLKEKAPKKTSKE